MRRSGYDHYSYYIPRRVWVAVSHSLHTRFEDSCHFRLKLGIMKILLCPNDVLLFSS